MIEVFKEQLHKEMREEDKINRMQELLQLMSLKIMYDKDILKNLSFVGGTALRIVFDLKRFSEDLDFYLIEKKGYDFKVINSELIRGFKLNGLNAESKTKDARNVNSILLKFSGLLKELGLSPLKDEKTMLKIEIDTNPPKGGRVENTFVNKLYTFNIPHFDLPSMFATKLHACFYRTFVKGRDFYDFIWYLSKKITPNYELLNNAIKQTQGKDPEINKGNFKNFLLVNIEKIDLNTAKADVERFLEDKSELKLFDLSIIKDTIKSVY